MKHTTTSGFHTNTVNVDLVGCGGTGSLVLSGLVRLHIAMRSLGHPGGLSVTAWDHDHVSSANIGRQLFVAEEVGKNKAEVLINRYNMHFGLNWHAKPKRYAGSHYTIPKVIISCVDSAQSRSEINQIIRQTYHNPYLIDGGNDSSIAQILIGNGSAELPYPYDVLPELLQSDDKEPKRPSCSLAEALDHQELFINQWVSTAILELLWRLFRKGGLDYRGFFINLDTGRMNPMAIEKK